MKCTSLLLTLLLLFLGAVLNAQSGKTIIHQVYLETPVKQVISVQYNDKEGSQLKYSYEPKSSRILLYGYNQTGSITINILSQEGNKVELFETPCHIDPVLPEKIVSIK